MGDFEEALDIDDTIIEFVRDRPPLHHANVYSESDEQYWDTLQKNTGIQSLYWLSRIFPLELYKYYQFLYMLQKFQNRG